MVYLVLDTNIWIYIAEGEHPDITKELIDKIQKGELHLLSNNIILDEWIRHKEKSIEKGKQKVINSYSGTVGSFKNLKSKLSESEKIQVDTIASQYVSNKPNDLLEVEERARRIDQLLSVYCFELEITEEMKNQTVTMALEKKAPFHNGNNSVADCLILLSALKYIKEDETGKYTKNAIFVTNNTADFSEERKGAKANNWHPDIQKLIQPYNLEFSRNAGEVLRLSSEFITEINDFLEYVEDQIIHQLEMEAEIRKGK